jgi:hypothetical protein
VGPPISALFDAVDIKPLTLAVRAPCSNCRASTASQGILLDGIVVFDGYGMVSRCRTPDRQRCAVLYELSLFKAAGGRFPLVLSRDPENHVSPVSPLLCHCLFTLCSTFHAVC